MNMSREKQLSVSAVVKLKHVFEMLSSRIDLLILLFSLDYYIYRSKLESKGQELPATFCLQLVEYPVTLTAQVDTEITAQIISE
ncbi:hypothetical protein T05_13730 [Trichinella murrelli]|uniref:Uncharacterized protein n=1 Tax=Trichinella murrelli TaxID=144512 RepID=A0A0V0T8N1_9BILA|nr:hypothetical protein T05_13730 [Trichinella murrelli]